MKTILTTLLLVCLTTLAQSQNTKMSIGRRTGCFGSGACNFTMVDETDKNISRDYNATFITGKDGSLILRIIRDRLTEDEASRVLSPPIGKDKGTDKIFLLEESVPLPQEIIAKTSTIKSQQITELKAHSYPTVISKEFIDITIIN